MNLESVLKTFFQSHASLFPPHTRLLVACSGGPDSVAFLLALEKIQPEFKFKVWVGHVNHGLRGPESNEDEKFVAKLAHQLGFSVTVKRVKRRRHQSGNLEEWARLRRYEALMQMAKRQRCPFVLTAHHLDDQAETVLMNLFRGSGASGLGGMPTFRTWAGTGTRICRPLLGCSKEDIRGYLKNSGIQARTDSMNLDPQFLRFWLRSKVVPMIEKRFPGFRRRMGNFSELVREEDAFWSQQVREMTDKLLIKNKAGFLLDWEKFVHYSLPLQRRFLKQVIGPDLLSFDNLEALRKWMGSPPADGRIWQLKKGWFVERMSRSKGAPSARLFWLGRDGQERSLTHT